MGLAEAVGGDIAHKRVEPRAPWNLIPANWALPPLGALRAGCDTLSPPWPDLVISCGRRVVGFALAIKRASGLRARAVHVQDPLIDPGPFDLVAAPAHDDVSGPNVIATQGALHRVTKEKLEEAAREFASAVADLPRPLVAVLIGGSNRRYRMTEASSRKLGANLASLCRMHGAGLAITASRRTSEANTALLKACLDGLPARIWDGGGRNPYFGYLALADAIVVTEDSVSMASEACATGKPVFIAALEGGGDRFRRFHASFRAAGMTRPFEGRLERWNYVPPDDTARVANAVRALLDQGRANLASESQGC